MGKQLIQVESGIKRVKNIIAVGSGKGGVGKSTVTASLARACKMLGLKVGVLDADIYGPSVDVMLPMARAPYEENGRIIPADASGIQTISISHFARFERANGFRAPIANAIIEQLVHKIDWGMLDLLLIDLPPGTGDIHLTLMQTIPLFGMIAVTTPQKVATQDVEKSIEMCLKLKVPVLGVVENMSYYQDFFSGEKMHFFGQGGGKFLSNKYSIPLFPAIPLDPAIGEAMDKGECLLDEKKEFASMRPIVEIAIELSRQICDDSMRKRAIGHVKQIDPYHIEISWGEKTKNFLSKELQKRCPCARCSQKQAPESFQEVEIKEVKRFGNYALQFVFTSGCSRGIYTWDQLI